MDADGVELQVVSPTPVFFSYDRPADQAVKVARIFNDLTLEHVADSEGRLLPFCQVPLQDPDAACAELDRCLAAGHVGVEIGNHVGERDLDDAGHRHLPAALRRGRGAGVRPPLGHARRASAGSVDGPLAGRDAGRDPSVHAGDDPGRSVRPRAGDAADLLRARRRQLPVLAGPRRQRLAPAWRRGSGQPPRTLPATTVDRFFVDTRGVRAGGAAAAGGDAGGGPGDGGQ